MLDEDASDFDCLVEVGQPVNAYIVLAAHAALGLMPMNTPYLNLKSSVEQLSATLFDMIVNDAFLLTELDPMISDIVSQCDPVADEWQSSQLLELEAANVVLWCIKDIDVAKSGAKSWKLIYYGYLGAATILGGRQRRPTWKRMNSALFGLMGEVGQLGLLEPSELDVAASIVDTFSAQFESDIRAARDSMEIYLRE